MNAFGASPIYLDYAATTPVRREVRDAMLPLLDQVYGNPSSVHRWGREARGQLESARARLAALIGASPTEVVFTQGGTEADNLAVLGCTRRSPGALLACSAVEHKAVLMAARAAEKEGNPLRILPVDSRGVVRLDAVDEVLRESPALVSVMWVNNEIGVLQPVAEIAERCRAAGVVFHSDAIQAFGKVPVRVDEVPVTLLSLSAHKIYGPKGVGALFVRRGTRLDPLCHGGGHERGLRAGTEDVAGAVAFALAAELAVRERDREMERTRALRDRLEAGLREALPDIIVNGDGAERAPHVLNVSVPGANNETLLLALDLEGLAVSSGSACSSGAVAPSHVLTAMGVPAELAGPSVRLSFGRDTTVEEIEQVIRIFPPLMERMRALTEGVVGRQSSVVGPGTAGSAPDRTPKD
jgi:cysteine desulfurase